MNPDDIPNNIHAVIWQIAIGYTFVGAIITSVILVLLSLVGIVKFAHAYQQRVLFSLVIVEILTAGIGVYMEILRVAPREASQDAAKPLIQNINALEETNTSLQAELQQKRDANILLARNLEQAEDLTKALSTELDTSRIAFESLERQATEFQRAAKQGEEFDIRPFVQELQEADRQLDRLYTTLKRGSAEG